LPIKNATDLYARGSVDDKGPAIVNLYAMKYIKDHNLLKDD
jgi:acetylornithine deacetylase/succinyl-diaminopimelate desuccinylase